MKKAEALILGELLKRINALVADEVTEKDLEGMFTVPPDASMGDLAFACFKLSKILRKAPQMIAQSLCEGFECEAVSRCEAVAGYINFYISDAFRTGVILGDILAKGDDFGKITIGEGKTMVIDYSSPNIAKPFHIGHLGTTAIGNAIKRIYSYCGSGMMLALLNIAHEITYPEWCGDCILNQGYKPIRPVIIEEKEA